MKPYDSNAWSFYQNERLGWSWHIDGAGNRHSEGHFVGIVEAFADAMNNGYRPGVSRIASVQVCRRLRSR
jgi:hypothetical protein